MFLSRACRAIGFGLALACWFSPGPAAAAAAAPKCKHTVKKGDTLSRIALKNGVSEANLIRANPKLEKNPNRLRIGQELEICRAKRFSKTNPSKCAGGGRIIRHEVDRGDTLISIARKYSVKIDTIRKYNKRLRRSNMIRVGQSVRVCTTSRRWTNRSWLKDGVQLPEGEGYTRRPNHAWGTPLAIEGIVAAIERYRDKHPDAPPVAVGDISRERGGPLGGHLSHQNGRDADIAYVFRTDEEGRRRIDLPKSWALVESFLQDDAKLGAVFVDYKLQRRFYEHAQSIGVDTERLDEWFEYPRNDKDAVVYHWPGHTGHFHVRFVDSLPEDDTAADSPQAVATRGSDFSRRPLPQGVARRRAVVPP